MAIIGSITLPTVRIYHPRKKKYKVVNERDWAADLGLQRYQGWVRAGGEAHNDSPEAIKIEVNTNATTKPFNPDVSDSVEINTNAKTKPYQSGDKAIPELNKNYERKVVIDDKNDVKLDTGLSTSFDKELYAPVTEDKPKRRGRPRK